jgi:hypothetical protein
MVCDKMAEVVDALSQKGPLLCSELTDLLVRENSKLERARIRQKVHRAYKKKSIMRLPVTFGKGEYLYYLPQETEDTLSRKIICAIKHRKRLNRIFEALRKRRIIPEWYVAKIAGVNYQVTPGRKVEPLSTLLNDLETLRLGRVVDFVYEGVNSRFLVLPSEIKNHSAFSELSKLMAQERDTVDKFITILVRSGLGRDFKKKPDFISVTTDALGECKPYLRARVQVHSKIMIDINTLWEFDNTDIDGLLDRVHTIRKEVGAYSVIVYVLANFNVSAFERANKIGWKALRPSRVSKIIHAEIVRQQGVFFFREASSANFKNIVRELQSFDELKNFGNYKSIVFEDMVRDFFDELGYLTRRRKKYYVAYDNTVTEYKPRTTSYSFEIDVLGIKNNNSLKIVVCECKHWLEPVDNQEIDEFSKKLDTLNDYYSNNQKTMVEIEGYFIGAELSPNYNTTAKTKLTVLTSEEFRIFAKRELTRISTAKHGETK